MFMLRLKLVRFLIKSMKKWLIRKDHKRKHHELIKRCDLMLGLCRKCEVRYRECVANTKRQKKHIRKKLKEDRARKAHLRRIK